jgi:hypothetical protein
MRGESRMMGRSPATVNRRTVETDTRQYVAASAKVANSDTYPSPRAPSSARV